MGASVRWKRRNVRAEQPDLSRIRPHVAADLVEQRGLSGAVRTDDQTPFTRPYREGDVLRNDEAAEGFLQVNDLEGVARCRQSHRGSPRNPAISLLKPGTSPLGITRTINRNTRPSSMFHRSR